MRAYAHQVRGALYLARGDGLEAALAEWQHARALAHDAGAVLAELGVVSEMARALAEAGRKAEGRRALEEVLARVEGGEQCPAVVQARMMLASP